MRNLEKLILIYLWYKNESNRTYKRDKKKRNLNKNNKDRIRNWRNKRSRLYHELRIYFNKKIMEELNKEDIEYINSISEEIKINEELAEATRFRKFLVREYFKDLVNNI